MKYLIIVAFIVLFSCSEKKTETAVEANADSIPELKKYDRVKDSVLLHSNEFQNTQKTKDDDQKKACVIKTGPYQRQVNCSDGVKRWQNYWIITDSRDNTYCWTEYGPMPCS